jgi:AcrR family transcriptional regulator
MELLEESGETTLSLRAVARRAGVSPAAPYRHYADFEALVSAVAALGYRELAERLAAAHPSPSTPEQLTSVAVAYVRFVVAHRVNAAIHALLGATARDGDLGGR